MKEISVDGFKAEITEDSQGKFQTVVYMYNTQRMWVECHSWEDKTLEDAELTFKKAYGGSKL